MLTTFDANCGNIDKREFANQSTWEFNLLYFHCVGELDNRALPFLSQKIVRLNRESEQAEK